MSTRGLGRARARVASAVQRGELAGAVLLASRRGEIAQLDCIGMREVEAGLPMESDTIFRIASMTKAFTAVGALMLVDAGSLRLDDPISRYIAEFGDMTVFAGADGGRVRLEPLARPITVEHLLTHTSGLFGIAPHPDLEPACANVGRRPLPYPLPELMRRLASQPLVHQPAEGWRYGWSSDVLGRLIEIVSDRPLDEYFESAIFAPLGMADSGFRVPPNKVGRLAAVYKSPSGVLERIDHPAIREIAGHPPALLGGSGCASTADDFFRFLRMLLGGGEFDHVRLLRAETVAEMTRNHLRPPLYPIQILDHRYPGEGYGLGFGVVVEPAISAVAGSAGTYEWAGVWNTHFRVDPAKEVIGIFLAQFDSPDEEHADDLANEYWSLVCRAVVD